MKRFLYLALALLFMATLIPLTVKSVNAKKAATNWAAIKEGGNDVKAAPLQPNVKEWMNQSPVKVDKRPMTREEIRALVELFIPGVDPFASPQAIGCEIRDPNGNPTTQVKAIGFGDQAYWFVYLSDGAVANEVIFIAIPILAGSPEKASVQVFDPGGSSADIMTPCSIPFWGGDATSGWWMLIVVNDLGDSGYCLFKVVP